MDEEIMRGMGDNDPPPATLAERLTEDNADIVRRAAEIEAGIDRFLKAHPEIASEEADSIAANFIGRNGVVTALLKVAEARRVEQVEPFLSGQRQINGFFDATLRELETPKSGSSKVKTLKALSTAYKIRVDNEKREALAREARERVAMAAAAAAEAAKTLDEAKLDKAAETAKAAEQAQQAAAAPASDLTRVHGSLGATTSLRTTWRFDEQASDLMALAQAVVAGWVPLDYLAFNTVRINYAVRSEKVRDVPGCEIREERSV